MRKPGRTPLILTKNVFAGPNGLRFVNGAQKPEILGLTAHQDGVTLQVQFEKGAAPRTLLLEPSHIAQIVEMASDWWARAWRDSYEESQPDDEEDGED